MENKLDKEKRISQWMEYLYGEMSMEERKSMEQLFAQDPKVREEYEALKAVRDQLSSLPDKEVLPPPIMFPSHDQRLKARGIKTFLGIAATLLLLMVSGWFLGLTMEVERGEFRLTFGSFSKGRESRFSPDLASQNSIQKMIDESLERKTQAMENDFRKKQLAFQMSLEKNFEENNRKMQHLMKVVSSASQEEIQHYVSSVQEQNRKTMENYFQLASKEQKKYVEDLIVDFSMYLQQQRKQDLQVIQTQFNDLQQNTRDLKQETEEVLASIITAVPSKDPGNRGIHY